MYGSTTHFGENKVCLSLRFARTHFRCSAVSAVMKGAGSFSSSTYFSSPISIIHLVCNPAAPGELPDPLNTLLAAYHEGLGVRRPLSLSLFKLTYAQPINVNISAPHLTVSSLVLFHFSLLSPPASLSENLLSISAFVEQTFSITYKDGTMARPPVQKFNLFRVDQSTRSPKSTSPSGLDTPSPALTTLQPLGETKEGEEWNYRHLVRLLDDDKIRSTTPDATATAIRVSHKIGVTIKFRRQDGVEETVQLSKKVHIASVSPFLLQGEKELTRLARRSAAAFATRFACQPILAARRSPSSRNPGSTASAISRSRISSKRRRRRRWESRRRRKAAVDGLQVLWIGWRRLRRWDLGAASAVQAWSSSSRSSNTSGIRSNRLSPFQLPPRRMHDQNKQAKHKSPSHPHFLPFSGSPGTVLSTGGTTPPVELFFLACVVAAGVPVPTVDFLPRPAPFDDPFSGDVPTEGDFDGTAFVPC